MMTEQMKEPSRFKQEWEAKKLLKQTKKKAKKAMMQRGHSRKEAAQMVNTAIKSIARTGKQPERKAAGRGG